VEEMFERGDGNLRHHPLGLRGTAAGDSELATDTGKNVRRV